jgi:uncharacterized damage-inducible protein DinB
MFMTLVQAYLNELQREAEVTNKILERVPLEKGDWKPSEKSMGLVRLATHVAEISGWTSFTVLQDELDFATMDYKPFVPENTAALLAHHNANVDSAQKALSAISDDDLLKDWTLRMGEQIYFTKPREEVLRGMCFNHLVHHRAQLGVYLRLLDIALPGSYGPTADEK